MKLASLFSDHAVFQRGKTIPVWGWTEPLALVSATLGTAAARTRSGADGHFLLRLPALPAGGPYDLTVRSGDESVTVRDILVGEVWIASGQSNMEWMMSLCDDQKSIDAATQSRIRLRFEHIGNGLASKDGKPLSHFVIAGLDNRFHSARATIDGNTILVSSSEVPAPVAVRYAWADNPEGCKLFNKNGYPASPFRTDCI